MLFCLIIKFTRVCVCQEYLRSCANIEHFKNQINVLLFWLKFDTSVLWSVILETVGEYTFVVY